MSDLDEATENPNDKMPAGKPLDPDVIVSEDDVGSAAVEDEIQEELDEPAEPEELEGLDNDLVNVGKFIDPAADANGPVEENDDQDEESPPDDAVLRAARAL